MNTHKEERLKRGMAYCKGCSKDLVDCRCRLDDLQADEVLHEVEPTPPSQIGEGRLVNADYLAGYNQARRDMEEYETEGEFSGKWEQWEETTDVINRLLKKVKELSDQVNNTK